MELRDEARAPSREFRELGEATVSELLQHQMSAFVDLQLDPSTDIDAERYRAIFYLPGSGNTAALLIDDEGGNPEWALLLE